MKTIFTRMLALALCLGFLMPDVHAAFALPSTPSSNEPNPTEVKSAVEAFKNLSRKEKKEKIKEVKKAVKEFKAAKKSGKASDDDQVLQVICAILLPPLGVYLHENEINSKFWIDLVLTLIFFIPGMIYALIVVLGG